MGIEAEINDKKCDILCNTHKNVIGTDSNYKHEIIWQYCLAMLVIHIIALYTLILQIIGVISFWTFLWGIFVALCSSEGVTIGTHRFYTHKSFKAKPILRAIFVILQSMSGQNSIFMWVRDHRLHHRYSDTDADPHNAKRGFFFSHIGWLMTRKHPLVAQLGRHIDLADLQADWMVMFQKKYFYPMFGIFAILIPISVPVYFLEETWMNSFLSAFVLRYVIHLNLTWLVNSAAHLYGTRPYDQNLQPVESWFISFISLGEGWHNYHHAFPWDYKAAELTMHFNMSADIIRFLETMGLVWDLKSASSELVEKRILRTGDGTHYKLGSEEARAAVSAVGWVHPLNPSYSTLHAPAAELARHGLPLFHDKDILDVNNIQNKKSF